MRARCYQCGWNFDVPEIIYEMVRQMLPEGQGPTEEPAQAVAVLHVVKRHPRDYEAATGKDIEQARSDYASALLAWDDIL